MTRRANSDHLQRTGSRAPKAIMQDQLSNHYDITGTLSGLGLFDRMKVGFPSCCLPVIFKPDTQDMMITYVTEHGKNLYSAISEDTHGMVTKLASDIEDHTNENLATIMKLFLSLLGRACIRPIISLFLLIYIQSPRTRTSASIRQNGNK